MESAVREPGQEIRKRPARGQKRSRKCRKDAKARERAQGFVGNKALRFLGAKDELKTNSVLSAKTTESEPKNTL
jgi:hypothetical protein